MDFAVCLSCSALLPADETICLSCCAQLHQLCRETDGALLVQVLRDSRPRVRAQAMRVIAGRHDQMAADALVACALRHPADIDEGVLVAGILATLNKGGPHRAALHYLMARHPAEDVKRFVFHMLSLSKPPIPDVSVPGMPAR